MNEVIYIGPSSTVVEPTKRYTQYKHSLWVGGNTHSTTTPDGRPRNWGKVIDFAYQVPKGLALKEARRQAIETAERNRPHLQNEYGVSAAEMILTAFMEVINGNTYTRPLTGVEIMQGEH